jgi:hypothetical protein
MPGAEAVIDAAERARQRQIVQRILASSLFEKSERLREFLSYVAERALSGEPSKIHEEEIAIAVFGRSLSAQNSDTIVRVHASQLRKRLQQYFAAEGTLEPVIIEIPKGSYTPVFRTRDAEVVDAGSAQSTLPAAVPAHAHRWILAAAALAIFLCGAGVPYAYYQWVLFYRVSGLPTDSRTVKEFWSVVLPPGRQTDIVLADSSLSLFADLIHRPVTLSEYLERDFAGLTRGLDSDPGLVRASRMLMHRQNTTIGDANLARKLGLLAAGLQTRASLFYARDYHTRAFKSDNVILVGARRANPWVELVEDRLNFRFGYDEERRIAVIENRAPAAGERASYAVELQGVSRQGYAVIALLPNQNNDGTILYFAGTEMEGTEVCGDFLTNEERVSWLRSLPGKRLAGAFPAFEVLLKTTVIGGATPTFDVVTYRVRR